MKICSTFLIISLCVLHATFIATQARPLPLIFNCGSKKWIIKNDNYYVNRPSRSTPPPPKVNPPPKPGVGGGVSSPPPPSNNNNHVIAYKFSSLDFIPIHNTASA
ncbi:hypothetical protein HN51_053218 [Arachis hypogaea]|uniref:Uncharacterized protein n=1 Tax=Arachis hypogaea TaxID=3818 RepID=A0A6B9V2C3_ARAHY|nr:uncharacterized protein DS421_19g635880 [Arachis hypogaea]